MLPSTTLIIADHVLPLACVDDFGAEGQQDELVEGAERMLAPPPLLANLGKASANAYWMDMTVRPPLPPFLPPFPFVVQS